MEKEATSHKINVPTRIYNWYICSSKLFESCLLSFIVFEKYEIMLLSYPSQPKSVSLLVSFKVIML